MALHFNFTKVVNHETLCLTPAGEISGVTDVIIWLTMAVDIGDLSAKTVENFIERMRMYEMVSGPMNVSAAQVRAHVGLNTNVSHSTDAAFGKKILRLMRERAKRIVKVEKMEDEEAKQEQAKQEATVALQQAL